MLPSISNLLPPFIRTDLPGMHNNNLPLPYRRSRLQTSSRVPAARVTQVFLQLLLVPNLHDKHQWARAESGNHCSKRAIDLPHDM